MTARFVTAVTLGAALLASAAAQAASCKKDEDCPSGQVCSAGSCTSKRTKMAKAADTVAPTEAAQGTKRTPYIGLLGLGIYDVMSNGSSVNFGFHAGGAANLVQITPDLPLIAWADMGLAFGDNTFYPFSFGAGVRYDKAGPVQLLGGAGFAWLPHSGLGPNPVGVRLMATVLYPLPQVSRNLSAQTQISFDILSDSVTMFAWTVGAGYAL